VLKEAVDYCATSYPAVPVWLVRAQLNLDPGSWRCPPGPLESVQPTSEWVERLYLSYVSGLLEAHTRCSQDPMLVLEAFSLALWVSRPPPADIFESTPPESPYRWWWQADTPVQPKHDAHTLQWGPESELVDRIIAEPSEYAYDDQALAVLCARYGFVRGLQRLYARSSAPTIVTAALWLTMLTQVQTHCDTMVTRMQHPYNTTMTLL
jgi:hypothetical protein